MNILGLTLVAAAAVALLLIIFSFLVIKRVLDSRRVAHQSISILERVLETERNPVRLAQKIEAGSRAISISSAMHDPQLRRRIDKVFSSVVARLEEPPPEPSDHDPEDEDPPTSGDGNKIPVLGIVGSDAVG